MRRETASILQGVYFLITGIWPLLHMRSFTAITGPKAELWLVKTIGLAISVIGWVLIQAGVKKRVTPEIETLALGSAASLAAVDVVYSAKGRILPVYLLDAVAEAGLIGIWLLSGTAGSREIEV